MESLDITQKDLLFIAAPNLIGYGIYYFTKEQFDEGNSSDAWYAPKPFLFFVIWTILYSYMGYFLSKSMDRKDCQGLKYNILALFFFAFLWMIIYGSGKKKNAMLVFIPLLNFSMASENLIREKFGVSFHLFTSWLIFALVLATYDEE